MDDWNWYSAHLREDFEKNGVKGKNYDKPFLSFQVHNELIVLNRNQNINGAKQFILLYNKNKSPILVKLISGDNDWDHIKYYLANFFNEHFT